MKKRIFIVDDEPKIGDLFVNVLRRDGFEAKSFVNPGSMLAEVDEGMIPHVIIADLMMPDMNGIELLEELDTRDLSLPVLIMTAHSSVQTAVEAMRLGAFHYLQKPVNLEEMRALLDKALALYDGPIRQDRSAVALDMVDASALLWRLHLTGQDVGPRWQELADAWDQHADGKLYPFNDWHAVMAYLGAGRDDRVDEVLAAMGGTGVSSETGAWARHIGRPLTEGFVAFWRGDHATAVARLYPARYIVNAFGGSHAQRDIIDWTLTEAALRGGTRDLAEGLAHERLAAKPHSAVNRAFLNRAVGSSSREGKAA